MNLNILKPKKSLNKAFLKVRPYREEIDKFKAYLIALVDQSNSIESEEHHKNLLIDFFKKTYYDPNHFINTKGRTDLVIHIGKDAKSGVGVIIEAKKPTNKLEMLSKDNINKKALQELVLYFLRERIIEKNLEIKYLIVTNIYEWFIFDAQLFDKLFTQNKNFIKQFVNFHENRLTSSNTEFFYREIAQPFIEKISQEISFTHFDIRDYTKALHNEDDKDDNQLIALFKLLSPEHLLKLPFNNDSNSLDKAFYNELLHIIGLTEIKDGGKKIIDRNNEGERNTGSLLENTIIRLESLDKISRMENATIFGATISQRLFNVGLELSITWVNRILFLKLLEAQLITYHKGDLSYAFLNSERIKNYDDLNSLFFDVLARTPDERNDDVKKPFEKVPYLNSSLFEISEIEDKTIVISNLRDEKKLPILSSTVLRDSSGKKRTGDLNALEYFFEFLNAYDFSSEGSESIQEENKTLINASVLGLIFEKINGYKDGSFFTPGFITMYMCRETICRAVLQKFKDAKGWDCQNLDQLYNKITDADEANDIINSLKICDPAVGSGHFLVSALNEIIAIKSELKILQDRHNKRLKEYVVEVVNDELIITDEDGELFEYRYTKKESQRVQEALFHEKQNIIENCLFGVDINPNSVKICRLRLWIELLKNAYYKNNNELETLPNIDINIKCGNSLISRFTLDSDLKQAFKKNKSEWTIDSYKKAVHKYREAENKEEKKEMEQLIKDIKSNVRSEINKNTKEQKQLERLEPEYYNKYLLPMLIENKLSKEQKKDKKELEDKISKLKDIIEEIRNNKIYENAFEWRFEFPEVLDNEGDFVGFDAVIGNPPYLRVRDENVQIRNYYFDNYKVSENQLDLYHLFIERSHLITTKSGLQSLIVPNAFLGNQNNIKLRKFILEFFSIEKIVDVKDDVFEEASVDVLIFIFNKQIKQVFSELVIAKNRMFKHSNYFDSHLFRNHPNVNFTITLNTEKNLLVNKITQDSIPLSNIFDTISGIKEYQVGKGKPKQNEVQVKERVFNSNVKVDDSYVPELRGKNLVKYSYKWANEYISYGAWLAEPRDSNFFKGEKILVRQIPGLTSLIASYVDEDFVVDQTAYIAKPNNKFIIDIYFYLGIINSKLLFWYFRNINNEFDLLFPKIKVNEFNYLPLPKCEKTHRQISESVLKIITNKKIDHSVDTSYLENEIDMLIYKFYGLTEDEIKIVEGYD